MLNQSINDLNASCSFNKGKENKINNKSIENANDSQHESFTSKTNISQNNSNLNEQDDDEDEDDEEDEDSFMQRVDLACGTRPVLPYNYEVIEGNEIILEIFFLCTNESDEDRPDAKVIWQEMEKHI